MQIPPGFLPQIMPGLVRAGILARSLGRHGGYVLARPSSAISLLEVIEAADAPPPPPRTCVLRAGGCQRERPCAVHPALAKAQEAVQAVLSGADFASLLERHRPEAAHAVGE